MAVYFWYGIYGYFEHVIMFDSREIARLAWPCRLDDTKAPLKHSVRGRYHGREHNDE